MIEAVGLLVLSGVVPWLLPWRGRHAREDPLRRWLLLGVIAAVGGSAMAIAPVDDVPAVAVIGPLALLATVPLIAVAAVIVAVRDDHAGLTAASHRFLEWSVLSAGVVLVYTTVVAGVGSALDAKTPAWLLVVTTGGLALVLEPARRWVRHRIDRAVYGERDDPLGLVRDVMVKVTTTVDIDALLPSLAMTVADAFRLDFVAIDIRAAGGWRRLAVHGEPTEQTETRALTSGDGQIGSLTLGWRDGAGLRSRDRAALDDIVPHVALAVGMVRLTNDVRRSSLATVTAREEERRRIRRDLHDGLGPSLTGVGMGLRTVARRLERTETDPTTLALLNRLADEVQASVGEVKRIVRDLRPTALDDQGLAGALSEFVRSLDGVLDDRARSARRRAGPARCRRGGHLPDRHRGAHQRRAPRRGHVVPSPPGGRRPRRHRRDRRRRRHRRRPTRRESGWRRCANGRPSSVAHSLSPLSNHVVPGSTPCSRWS